MKSQSISIVFPAVALSLGATAAFSQPSYAYSSANDYLNDTRINVDEWTYSDRHVQIPELDQAYRPNPSNYHYAYYYIARPEYLL
jgi:hypothetical protein